MAYRVDLIAARSGRPLAALEAPDQLRVTGMAFTPDGERLLTYAQRPAQVRVWDLRLLREQLAALGLDWEAPPFPTAAAAGNVAPPRVEVELVNLAEQAARAKKAEGDRHREEGAHAEAVACYRDVLQREPHNAVLLNRLAWLLAVGSPEMRDAGEALRRAGHAGLLDPWNTYYQNTLGAAQFRAGRLDEALRTLKRVAKANPENLPWRAQNVFLQALCHQARGEGRQRRRAWAIEAGARRFGALAGGAPATGGI